MDPQLETVELDGDQSLRSLHYQCPAFQEDHGWHYHPECEISLIVEGAGMRFVGDSVEPFFPGDLVLIGPNIPHCWTSDENEKQNEMMVLQFSPECLGEGFLNIPEAVAFTQLLTHAKRAIQIRDPIADSIKQSLDAISQTQGLPRIARFIELLDTLCQAEDIKLLTSDVYLADKSEFHSGRLGKVMAYLKDNLAEDIKQTDVANIVNMTPQSFSRFFRATTGRTFVSFVNVMRISEACRLLVNSQQDITEIAYQCGYANLSNFNRRFSEIKQTTPSEYRKQHQQVS